MDDTTWTPEQWTAVRTELESLRHEFEGHFRANRAVGQDPSTTRSTRVSTRRGRARRESR